jgi:hypothetical protein
MTEAINYAAGKPLSFELLESFAGGWLSPSQLKNHQ